MQPNVNILMNIVTIILMDKLRNNGKIFITECIQTLTGVPYYTLY